MEEKELSVMICPLSPAHFVALGAFQLSALFLFIDSRLVPFPLVFLVVLCCLAPLFPRFSFFLPVISRGNKTGNAVALTFDDGPDPATTPRLLDLLDAQGITATFFVTGRNAVKYPELVREIIARGHTVGNHSYNHSPFLMLKGHQTLRWEIERAQEVLKGFGVVPLAFRPPVGITSPRLWRILLEQGMFCVNFSRRSYDRGNRRIDRLADRIVRAATPGDIILLHDVAPRRGDVDYLLSQFSEVISGIRRMGLEVVPLAQLIRKDIVRYGSTPAAHPVESFYDGLAATYDEEQFQSAVSLSRQKELTLFETRSSELLKGANRVLEIGAGTGIFTLKLAAACREITAVDISEKMLALLRLKAKSAGLDNIRPIAGNIEEMELEGDYSVVCAFLSLEYITDLPRLFQRLRGHLEPGGVIYFTIARRSIFRFFVQIGNAMRQGIWLRAYGEREMERMLKDAGFVDVSITPHLLKSLFCGGMLMEVVARNIRGNAVAVRNATGDGRG